jgi:quinol monooxygenase YgiN
MMFPRVVALVLLTAGLAFAWLNSPAWSADTQSADDNPLVARLKELGLQDKPFTLIVEVKVKPGSEKKLEELMLNAAVNTHKEPGCLMYDIHRDPETAGKYVFLERFKGVDGLNAHLAGDYTKKLLSAFATELAEPPAIRIINQFSPVKE